MSAGEFDAGAWLDAVAKLMELPIAEEFRPGVLLNLKITAEHAAILDGFVPNDHLDPAPVFQA
ncbi:MAG: DUF4089 domain-containing protein [Hyphomicrobiales bacterium]